VKKNQYAWVGYLLPQVALLPLVYVGTLESSKISMKFFISLVMLYILYICFSKIYKSKTKVEFEKVKRNVYSGFLTYLILTVYMGMLVIGHFTSGKQFFLMVGFILLQLLQYVLIVLNYRISQKIS
jgi:hypothetical protein